MDRNALEWYDLLARGLLWAGGIVLLLSLIGAVVIAGSDNAVGIAPEAEEQGRGFIALASLGGGIAAAGVLAGLGALLRLAVADRLERLPAKPKDEPAQPDPKQEKVAPKREKKAAPKREQIAPKREKAAPKRRKAAPKREAAVPKLQTEPRRKRGSGDPGDEGSKSGE